MTGESAAGTGVPPEPPRHVTRVSAVYWLFRGIEAAEAGRPVTACPFDPEGSTTDFYLAHWWIKGWRSEQNRGEVDIPRS